MTKRHHIQRGTTTLPSTRYTRNADAMTKLPDDSPILIAFNQYKATQSYENTKKWALYPEHVEGSLWAAFMEGWELCELCTKVLKEHEQGEEPSDGTNR